MSGCAGVTRSSRRHILERPPVAVHHGVAVEALALPGAAALAQGLGRTGRRQASRGRRPRPRCLPERRRSPSRRRPPPRAAPPTSLVTTGRAERHRLQDAHRQGLGLAREGQGRRRRRSGRARRRASRADRPRRPPPTSCSSRSRSGPSPAMRPRSRGARSLAPAPPPPRRRPRPSPRRRFATHNTAKSPSSSPSDARMASRSTLVLTSDANTPFGTVTIRSLLVAEPLEWRSLTLAHLRSPGPRAAPPAG